MKRLLDTENGLTLYGTFIKKSIRYFSATILDKSLENAYIKLQATTKEINDYLESQGQEPNIPTENPDLSLLVSEFLNEIFENRS